MVVLPGVTEVAVAVMAQVEPSVQTTPLTVVEALTRPALGRPVALVRTSPDGVPPDVTTPPLALVARARAVATPVPRPVIPESGAALAVIDVLQPKPVEVVQISASAAAEHDETAWAVGDAEPAVALTSTVFPACTASTVNGMVPAPATVPENVGLGMVNPVGRVVAIDGAPPLDVTKTPLFAVARFPRTPALS